MNLPTPIALAACLSVTCCATQPTICPVLKETVLPVSFTNDGRPLVDVQIGGNTEHMLVDTGAIVTFLTPDAARALNLKHFAPSSLTLMGVGGEQKDLPATYLTIGLGGLHMLNTLTMINTLGPALPSGATRIDGAIGNNMLKPFDIDLDLPAAQLSLYRPQNCVPGVSLPPWPPPYGVADFYQEPDAESMAFIQLDKTLLPAVVDTGADTTLIPSSILKPAGVAAEKTFHRSRLTGVGYGPGAVHITPEQFGYIRIGAEADLKPWLLVADDSLRLPEVIIGEDYLRHHRLFLANSTEKIYFGLLVAAEK